MKTYKIKLNAKINTVLTEQELRMKIVNGIFGYDTELEVKANKNLEIIDIEMEEEEKEIKIFKLGEISAERAKAKRLLSNIEEIATGKIDENDYFMMEDKLTRIIKDLKRYEN